MVENMRHNYDQLMQAYRGIEQQLRQSAELVSKRQLEVARNNIENALAGINLLIREKNESAARDSNGLWTFDISHEC